MMSRRQQRRALRQERRAARKAAAYAAATANNPTTNKDQTNPHKLEPIKYPQARIKSFTSKDLKDYFSTVLFMLLFCAGISLVRPAGVGYAEQFMR
jgi:hypothetical protein